MLQACTHPNIVRYLGRYNFNKHMWIVMEHCAGGNVSDLMHASGSGKPLEEPQIAYICCQTLKGLTYLHTLFKVGRLIENDHHVSTDECAG